MKRELLYGIFAILSTFVLSFAMFIFIRGGSLAPYIALVLSFLAILIFTHFYFKRQKLTPNTNAQKLSLVMLATTVILYVVIVAIIAGKGINLIYSSPFWATAIESVAVPFAYAKFVKRTMPPGL